MTSDSADELFDRLDLLQATLRLAFRSQIDEAARAVRADPASASILDLTQDWVGSTQLQEAVAEVTGLSTRRIRDRLADLCAQGFLRARGSENRKEYRSTGLV